LYITVFPPADFTLFEQSDLKIPNVTHNTHTTCTVIASDRLSEKLKKLKVDGSLQISILSGLLDIKGSANFLNKNPINPSESIVHVRCHHRTVVKSLTNDQLSKGKVRYADFSSRPGFNSIRLLTSSRKFIMDPSLPSHSEIAEIQHKMDMKKLLRHK
jgi:hypothetical protein